jgi:hypothetical protein
MNDFALMNLGTIWTLRPENEVARTWIDDNVSTEPWQWFGTALAVDPHYVEHLVLGIENEGLTVGYE